MKRLNFVLVVGLLILAGSVVFAEESVLIDFTKLTADTTVGKNKTPTENGATLVDFSNVAGATFTDEEKAAMKTSLALGNWGVTLASSSRSVKNQSDTMTRESPISAKAKPFNGEEIANKKVLGVRVHFPVESFNSWAIIQPSFDIPAYADKTALQGDKLVVDAKDAGRGEKFNGYGVVKNVGVLKTLSVTAYGANFPNGLGVVLQDQDGNEQVMFMDYLQFDGWRTLTWNNPNYIVEVRNRELRKYPLYPKSTPHVKLIGIIIYRDAAQEGGDFITYIKDIKITYDKAIIETERDINDEVIWNILQARYEARRMAELKRLGNLQVLQYLEKQKMHVEPVK
jgi:hypothetical protein